MRPVLAVLALLLPAAAAAQTPAPSPAAPAAPLGAGEVRVRADSQGGDKGRYQFRGFVDLQAGELRIQADRLDFVEEPKPGGTARRIEAEGNVVFLRGEERLAGEKLRMDLDSGEGVFEGAVGYLQPGVLVEADRIERVDATTYRIHGGRFTSCYQPNPRWSFQASSATLEVDDKITAKNVLFKVKQVPAFYIPFFAYPIQKDQRSSGVLFPHFGYSSARGFNVGSGLFWAMGRSVDQTLYLDHYSRFGWGLGHELRYTLASPSRALFRSYFFRPQDTGGELEYDLDWTALQMLPFGAKANVSVREYSDLAFQQRIHENVNQFSTRSRRSTIDLTRTAGYTTLQLTADSAETFFVSGNTETTRTDRRLPAFTVNRASQRFRGTGLVFTFSGRAENLGYGTGDRYDRYSRIDINPRLSRPLNVSFLQVTPAVQVRYSRYGASLVDGAPEGPSVDRRFAELRLETVGPTVSRVFNTPGNFYAEKFKHVIGPEVGWTYRTAVEDFARVPKYDIHDYHLGTNQVTYALVNRLYAKRRNRATGKQDTLEVLQWRLGQTYYVNIGEGQNDFDPNYSSAFFGPGGVPAHYSPLQSRLRFRPTQHISSSFHYEYDVNFKQTRSLGLSASIGYDRLSLQGDWYRSRRAARRVENRVLTSDTARGSARLGLLPGRLTVEGSLDYDLLYQNLVQATARARWTVQCCGFTVEVLKSDYNIKQDRQIRFSIELANIGSIGNFMGQEATDGRRW